MKKYTIFLLIATAFIIASCSTAMQAGKDKLFANSWELEYITGPRITFQGLFPDDKPVLTFNKEKNMVNGTTGCNGYSTTFKSTGNSITFDQPGPATLRYCGDGEQVFTKAMQGITSYNITNDGKLELVMNDVVMMRFKNSAK